MLSKAGNEKRRNNQVEGDAGARSKRADCQNGQALRQRVLLLVDVTQSVVMNLIRGRVLASALLAGRAFQTGVLSVSNGRIAKHAL